MPDSQSLGPDILVRLRRDRRSPAGRSARRLRQGKELLRVLVMS